MRQLVTLAATLLLGSAAYAAGKEPPKDCKTLCKEQVKRMVDTCRSLPKSNPTGCSMIESKFGAKCVQSCQQRQAEKARGQR